MRALRIAAVAVACATYAFMALAVAGLGDTMGGIPWWGALLLVIPFLTPVTVGLLIAIRQPRNRIAWIMLLGAFALTLQVPSACSPARAGRSRSTVRSGRCSTPGRSRSPSSSRTATCSRAAGAGWQRCRRVVLRRLHGTRGLLDPEPVRRRRRRPCRTRWPTTRVAAGSRTRLGVDLGAAAGSGCSRASSPARSRSGSGCGARRGSSGCRRCGWPGRRR